MREKFGNFKTTEKGNSRPSTFHRKSYRFVSPFQFSRFRGFITKFVESPTARRVHKYLQITLARSNRRTVYTRSCKFDTLAVVIVEPTHSSKVNIFIPRNRVRNRVRGREIFRTYISALKFNASVNDFFTPSQNVPDLSSWNRKREKENFEKIQIWSFEFLRETGGF